MVVKAHWNPSTLKVAYKSSTNKIQTFDTNPPSDCWCQLCDPSQTPQYITVKLSNFVFCGTGCISSEGCPSNHSYKVLNEIDINGIYTLKNYSPLCCRWTKLLYPDEIGTITIQYFSDLDCLYYLFSDQIEAFIIQVDKTGTNQMKIQAGISPFQCGSNNILLAAVCNTFSNLSINNCMDLQGSIGETNTCGMLIGQEAIIHWINGSITVIEGMGGYDFHINPGSFSPDCSCNYVKQGTYNSKSYYARTDAFWYIWYNGAGLWYISEQLGVVGDKGWVRNSSATMLGSYVAYGLASGNPAVALGGH